MPKGKYKKTEEHKRKISIALKGRILPDNVKRKISSTMKGVIGHLQSKETKEKLRKANLGKKHSEKTKKKMSLAQKGKAKPWFRGKGLSVEHRKKIGKKLEGINNPMKQLNNRLKLSKVLKEKYKNRKKPRIEMTIEWKLWREAVFQRDNYICQKCGKVGGRLDPHHKKDKSRYPELVFDVDNGITLCHKCHLKTDNYGSKAINR